VPDRRRFLMAGALAALLTGCAAALPGGAQGGRRDSAAALTARPAGTGTAPPAGTAPLGLGVSREPLLHVPPGLDGDGVVPLLVALHGAGGDAAAGLAPLRALADERGLLLLAPSSRGPTWDAVRGGYGADVGLLDQALDRVFATVPVDGDRVAVSGFSDGASYALGLGLANGALFRRVVAFSPGFVPGGQRVGRPAVYVAHGDADQVLPVARTSRRIVPALEADGYDVTYREFAGPHTVPPEVAREAVDWLGWNGPR
jgi:phospholipase/carboxylesterase